MQKHDVSTFFVGRAHGARRPEIVPRMLRQAMVRNRVPAPRRGYPSPMANRLRSFRGERSSVRLADRKADRRRDPADLLRETIELSRVAERLRVAGERARADGDR